MNSSPDAKISKLVEESNRIGTEFLLTDLNTGLIFLQVAQVTSVPAGRARNFEKALEVYRTVTRLLPRVVPSPDQQSKIHAMLGDLKGQLEKAGYFCEPPA